MDAGAIVERVRGFFAADPRGAMAAYLFGSIARGDAGKASDVDVAVLYLEEPPRTFEGLPLRLEEALDRELGRPVDVVVLNTASSDLVHRVLRDGVVVLDRNRPARLEFEVRARNEHFDMAPILARYRRREHVRP